MTPEMGGGTSGGMALQPPEPSPVERFTRRRIDLPFIYDFSGAPQAHVDGLIRRAIDELGFEDGTGPTRSIEYLLTDILSRGSTRPDSMEK